MKLSDINLKLYKTNDLIEVSCTYCNSTFLRVKHQLQSDIKHNRKIYCNSKCDGQHKSKLFSFVIPCKTCGKKVKRVKSDKSKSGNYFCSRSCSAIYNNKHKSTGTRRSKLEIWLEQQLNSKYPDIKIKYNKKDTIGSELDIYIPSLKLAFELNGIFHYEPIFGKDKLNQIQNNDSNKFQKCIEHNINLCIIDTSSLKYFKEQSANKYLKIITEIIDNQ